MQKHSRLTAVLLISTAVSLVACGEGGGQWLDPDKTFAALAQPDVKGVNDTQEETAKAAMAAGEFTRASQLYEILSTSEKATSEQKYRYRLGVADAARRMGDNPRALGIYEKLVSEDANNMDAAEGRALTLMALGKSVEASQAFSDVMEKDPKRWRTLNALGILFVIKNMVPEAMAYYTEALKFSPDNPAVLNNVGLSQAIDKQYPRAVDALEKAASLSKTPGQRKQIEMNQAIVHAVSGDLDKAKALASKYYDGAALDNNMGLYAHLSKDDRLAKTYLNMALSQSPTFYERAWNNLDVVNENATFKDSQPDVKLPKLNK